MRRANISDIESANRFLVEVFLPKLNAKLQHLPAKKADVHRKPPEESEFLRILSIREERTVQNDWTIRWHNQIMQLPRLRRSCSPANASRSASNWTAPCECS